MSENFTLTLRALRVNKKMTQKQTASELGINLNTWQNWETAKTFPDVPDIEKIEEYFHVRYENINFYP